MARLRDCGARHKGGLGNTAGKPGERGHPQACEDLGEREEFTQNLASKTWEFVKGAECLLPLSQLRVHLVDHLIQGSAHSGSVSKVSRPPVFVNMVFVAPAMPTHLCAMCGGHSALMVGAVVTAACVALCRS